MAITIRCVGIYFQNKQVPFLADMPAENEVELKYMSGHTILAAAARHHHLQYELSKKSIDPEVKKPLPEGVICHLGYTPTHEHPVKSSAGSHFTFYDKHLSLTQTLLPFY